MERYIGLDAHAASCTVAVMGPSGRRLKEQTFETHAKTLVEFIRSVAGSKRLCMEEGELSQWLYEVLEPHVDELAVVQPSPSWGNKSDSIDAWKAADLLRTNSLPKRVFKTTRRFGELREAVRLYEVASRDQTRAKNRLRAAFRARGVGGDEGEIYNPKQRQAWLKKLPQPQRHFAQELALRLDAATELHDRAEKWLHEQAGKCPEVTRLRSMPALGPVRAAQVVATVVSPERFRTKRQFWAYCGLAIVTRSSSDWQRSTRGMTRVRVAQTRGLNRDGNPMLKEVFCGAAQHIIDLMRGHPLHRDYQRMLAGGTKPNLARLTLARRLAAATLAIWKNKEEYDPAKHGRTQDAA
jgi:transposase